MNIRGGTCYRQCAVGKISSLARVYALRGPIAQSVEQMAFNHWVEGSSPSRITIFKGLRTHRGRNPLLLLKENL